MTLPQCVAFSTCVTMSTTVSKTYPVKRIGVRFHAAEIMFSFPACCFSYWWALLFDYPRFGSHNSEVEFFWSAISTLSRNMPKQVYCRSKGDVSAILTNRGWYVRSALRWSDPLALNSGIFIDASRFFDLMLSAAVPQVSVSVLIDSSNKGEFDAVLASSRFAMFSAWYLRKKFKTVQAYGVGMCS